MIDPERFTYELARLAAERGRSLAPDDIALACLATRASAAGARLVMWTDPIVAALWADAKREVTASPPATAPAEHPQTQPPVRHPVQAPVTPTPVQPSPAHSGEPGEASVAQRVGRLSEWRESAVRKDTRIEALSRWDFSTLAESGATTADEVRAVAPRLNAAVVAEEYADAISAALSAPVSSSPAPKPPKSESFDDGPWILDGWFAPSDYSQAIGDDVVLPGLDCSFEDGHVVLRWRRAVGSTVKSLGLVYEGLNPSTVV